MTALLVVPVLALINSRTRTGGGDGLQGFGEILVGYGTLALLSVGFVITGWIRRERPWWLALVAIALLVLPLFALAF